MSIELKGIDFTYQNDGMNVQVLEAFDLSVESGKIIGIVGPSGSGKSTILRLIAGLLNPTTGIISINGKSADQSRKENEFGLVFQSPDLLPWRTLLQNIALPLELRGKKVDVELIKNILKDVGLSSWENKYPHQLSGGMKQRAALARALVAKPKILLLDEPFSQLDELLRFELLFYVQQYSINNGATVFFVTHDISEAVIASDVIFILNNPPVNRAERIEIAIPRPRSLVVPETKIFHESVSQIRSILRKQNPNV